MGRPLNGFKVVCRSIKNRVFHSCNFGGDWPTSICRPYKENEWTSPYKGNGPLCVFKTLDNAIEHCKRFGSLHYIYKCKFYPSKKEKIWFESDGVYNKHDCPIWALPVGTLLATRIMITEQLGIVHHAEWEKNDGVELPGKWNESEVEKEDHVY